MKLWKDLNEANKEFSGVLDISGGRLKITNKSDLREKLIDALVYNAVFSSDQKVKDLSLWIIWEAGQTLGALPCSIHDFYMARAANKYHGLTVPAINIRGLTYEVARTIFKTSLKDKAYPIIFEIAKSEMEYTGQRPQEYTTCILGAALKEGFVGPVFIQGDHFQAKAKNYKTDPKGEIEGLKKLIKEAIEAGFYNIDIDSSTLVVLERQGIKEQQRDNFEVCAALTKFIRELEPKGITVSVGGEIGEVGEKNSTPEELIIFMESYLDDVKGLTGVSKISVQTGTSHGGIPLPDGTVAKVKLDFDVLEKLGKIGREQFKIGGVVQHGASTLPEEAFDNFPRRETLEVHLATGFQNIIYDSEHFPKPLREKIYNWLDANCAAEKKPDQTHEQFIYKSRKKGFGTFKKELWDLPQDTRLGLMDDLAKTFEMLWKKLGIYKQASTVDKFIKPIEVHKKIPA